MSLGSLLTPKGEDSEEDEDTEYFDAMEDSTSFITVITEAKEDRWALRAGQPPQKDPFLGQPFPPCSFHTPSVPLCTWGFLLSLAPGDIFV